jgi:hypothetical protein
MKNSIIIVERKRFYMKLLNRTVALVITCMLVLSATLGAAAGQAANFSDVKAGDWFKPFVDVMSEKGICVGYGNGKYGPRDNLQVDQLIKLVVIAIGYRPEANATDKDWAAVYINKAKELGLVKDGEYTDYKRKITRGEIARIIARGMKEAFPENLDAYQSVIKDYSLIGTSFREYILKAYCKGIVNGYPDGRFGASDSATRGEASKMIISLIDPSERTVPTLPNLGTEFIRGYVIPTSHTATFDTSSSKCDIGISIRFNLPLETQEKEVNNVLSSKFGNELTEKIMEYVKTKKLVEYILEEKKFTTPGYEIIVKGGGWTANIIIYKK